MNPYESALSCYVCCIVDDPMEYPVVTWLKGTPLCREHIEWVANADLFCLDDEDDE